MKKIIVILSVICFAFASDDFRPIHIFMVGDSTMANKPEKDIPEYGWGQVLQHFFNDSVLVDNHAKNGRSSKSFIDEGKWETVITQVQKGDYVIIQFGHNDSKNTSERFTNPFTTYKYNLEKFVNETRVKEAIPILCTSIVRRDFNEDGTLKDTHGDYLTAVRQVADEYDIYFIDMESKTKKLVEEIGSEKSKQMFLHFKSGIYPLRPKGLNDNTHLSQEGAYSVAGLAIEGMKELNLPLLRYMVKK
jgi:pectinesterase